jgi:hypothetical protein
LPAIAWDSRKKQFLCCDNPLSLATVGSSIAKALAKGEKEVTFIFENKYTSEWTELWNVRFSTDYVLAMLGFVAEHGWFWDAVKKGDDHDFDPTRITPGPHWSQVEKLRGMAADLEACVERHTVIGGSANMVAELNANARKLSAQADRLLRLDVPPTRTA